MPSCSVKPSEGASRRLRSGLGRVLVLGLVLAASQIACTTPGPAGYGAPDRQAEELLRRGEPEAAAAEFLRLAAIPAPDSYRYSLRAAEAYIAAGRVREARDLLETTEVPEWEPDWSSWKAVLRARVALLQNDAAHALTVLRSVPADAISTDIARQVRHERGRAYAALGQGLEAAREYIEEARFLGAGEALDENARAIWSAIHQVDAAVLSRERPGLSGDLLGWVELAEIGRSRFPDAAAFQRALADWQGRYPGHPAGFSVVPTLAERPPPPDLMARHIGLLLPLSGQFADAARAIRDGFVAAWYEDRAADPERMVVVYDATAANVRAVYDQALADGADFIVGPLEKPAIQTLLGRGPPSVPTLALNQIGNEQATSPSPQAGAAADSSPASYPPGLYQFALSPEDEARQIAERAWLDGRERALVLAPESAWGARIAGAFKRHWESLGGRIAASKTFHSAAHDYASAVEALVAASGRSVPGPTSGAPGEGAEFVFMVATPIEGRQIQPQLAQMGDFPVYATSQVYGGTRAPEADRDLEGVMFLDTPWMLTPERVPMRAAIARHFAQRLREQPRLVAFGVDAYGLISRLADLTLDPARRYEGVTGTLHLDGAGRVQRNLLWGRFSAGVPVLLEP